MLDSREGFSADEEEAYNAFCDRLDEGWDEEREEEECDCGECDDCYARYDGEYDGQPDAYTEWQDYMGGDDSEYGTYGEYDYPDSDY